MFDTVATAADLEAVLDLVGWTNDRLVAERIDRLPQHEWVYGRPNASVVMAAFLHVAPVGMRFNGPELGAWYAAADLKTSAVEVAHHLRREAVARQRPEMSRTYRAYSARLDSDHVDIRGTQSSMSELFLPDSYAASQEYGERMRASGEVGIIYDSVRLRGGENVVAFRPSFVMDVIQTDHFEITVRATEKQIEVRKMTAVSDIA